MRLRAGQAAPLFDMTDLEGWPLSLAAYRGTRVLLSFYRPATCPLCMLRLRHLIERSITFRQQGLTLIAFFESTTQLTRECLGRIRPPFPIVPDPERKVYGLYGLESSLWGAARARLIRRAAYREAGANGIRARLAPNVVRIDRGLSRMPAEFLLGPDLRISMAYYGRDSGDFLLFSEIDAFLAIA